MQLFFHNVGVDGAARDFPKTVFNRIPIAIAEHNIPLDAPYREEVIKQLHYQFPSGSFNCWGVPSGAESVIKQLNVGDAILLIKTTGNKKKGIPNGEVPALGIIKVFVKEQMRELSDVLWGELGYPYIFFFDTEIIDLTWTVLRDDIGYPNTYRPPAIVSIIAKLDKIEEKFIGIQGYLDFLRSQFDQQLNNVASTNKATINRLDKTPAPLAYSSRNKAREEFKAYKGTESSAVDTQNRAIGLAGELQVLKYEQEYLESKGRSDLAAQVRHASQLDGDGLGYDILSYNLDESIKYIEVKTTTGSAITAFYITDNEIQFSEQFSINYYLYRVYQFDIDTNTGKFYVKPGSIKSSFELKALEYRATVL